jgi:integrase
MHVYKYLIPRLGALPLRRLTTTRINATYRELREGGRLKDSTRPLSALTVRHTHAVLRLALKEAVAAGKIPSNPAIGAKLPHDRGEKREMVTWTATQLMAFLDFTSDSRMADFWRVAAFTGLRRGELAGLQWHDVTWPIDDEAAGGLRIRRSRVSVGGKATDSLPKTEAGGRDVAIDPGVIDALRRQRARQLADAAKWGAAWQDSAHVFTIENGQPLHPERISFLFDEAVAAAKVPRIRLHDLRHTHATMALEAGVPVKIVSQRLGHSSTRITQDVYQHVLKEQQQDAAQAIADYVKRSSTPLHAVPRDDQEKAR